VKYDALEDFTFKTERMTFNNFCLAETPADPGGEPALLKLKACYRNRSALSAAFTLVVVGLDGDDDPVWAFTITGSAPGKDIGLKEASVPVTPGALKRTASVRLSAYAAPLAGGTPPASGVGHPPSSGPLCPSPLDEIRGEWNRLWFGPPRPGVHVERVHGPIQ
jgi:hypothetical protein